MKTKFFQILCILIFFITFGYLYGDEYWKYQEENTQLKEYNTQVSSEIESFTLGDIAEFPGNIELFTTPDLDLLDTLVAEIDAAQKKVYVEVYIFTEKRLRDALIAAHQRGVEVKILLENNPYQAPYLNDAHYNAFKDAGVDVRWSDPLNYSLNHSKLLIIDSVMYVSTGNFSYSLFKYNRDFLVRYSDIEFNRILEQLFLQDFSHIKGGVYHSNLILSPDYSRQKLQKLVASAQTSIDFYFPYLSDKELQNLFFEMSQKGIKIRGIVEEGFYKENQNMIEEFTRNSIEIHPLTEVKLHGKAILIDRSYLYFGSINFSKYSFDENREVGVLLSEKNIIGEFQKIFESDL